MARLIIYFTYLFLFGAVCIFTPTPLDAQVIQKIEQHQESGSIDDLMALREVILSKKTSYGTPVIMTTLSADPGNVGALMLSSESFRLFPKRDGYEQNIEMDPVIRRN